MMTVLVDFIGYPDPKAKGVQFRAGQALDTGEWPKDFITMVQAKGLVSAQKQEKAK